MAGRFQFHRAERSDRAGFFEEVRGLLIVPVSVGNLGRSRRPAKSHLAAQMVRGVLRLAGGGADR